MGKLLETMTQGSFERSFLAHYKDLRGIYAKRMECHGNGMALMQPVSGEDCHPVCCGYFDRNGNWNLITRLTVDNDLERDDFFEPLEYMPTQSADVDITWQPKASLGVMAHAVDASGETPDGLPGGAGADVHIRYTSNSKFGAVLMTTSPVRLRAYNDEALFASWLSRNKSKLYQRYGPELKKYGLWIVTRTYTTQRASINAWMDKDKQSMISLKAKAAMLGELGEELDWRDKALSKDWTIYQAKTDDGVVVFMDGLEVGPVDWWLEGVRYTMLNSSHKRERHLSEYVPDPIAHQATAPIHQIAPQKSVLKKTAQTQPVAGASESQSRRGSRILGIGRRKSEPGSRPIARIVDPAPNRASQAFTDDATLALPGSDDDDLHDQQPRKSSQDDRRASQSAQPPRAASPAPHRQSVDRGIRRGSRAAESPHGRKASQSSASPRLLDSLPNSPEPFHARPRDASGSLSLPPIRRIREQSRDRPQSMLLVEEAVLHDAGMSSVSRSQSLRRTSISSSIRTPSVTQSLRRDSRSVHDDKAMKASLGGPDEDHAFEFFSKEVNRDMQGMLPPHMGLPAELGGTM